MKTGDVSGAGTDANVFIVIYGEKGDTGEEMRACIMCRRRVFDRLLGFKACFRFVLFCCFFELYMVLY